MIQKIQKAQALTEMALFGTLILLCFYYLINYVQRMNEQQYVMQEAFRSALEKASSPEKGFVAYNIFSNRRQVSINSPLIGERSQLSGSGQVYWGAVEYYLPEYDPDIYGGDGEVYGPEIVAELELKQYYRFNKDEIDLTSTLERDEDDEDEEEESSGLDIVIASDSDRDSSTTITYSDSNISSQSRAGEEDVVTYTLTDKDSGSALYTISQGLDADGEYSQAAVGTKVYNVMSPDNSDRVWEVPK